MIKTGNKIFWIAQIVGWSIIASTNLLVQVLADFPNDLILYNTLAPMMVGFLLTTIYRYFIRKLDWRKWDLKKTLIFLIVSTFILSSVFIVSVFIVVNFIFDLHPISLASFISNTFIITLIIFTWNLIYFAIHYFNNWTQAEIEKWQLTAEIKDAQLGSLKTQIEPHFVFNTINNIRSLILEDKDKAREMLLNFSDLFRYALKNSDQSRVELQEELEIVNQYLELLSIQYEDKLSYKIHLDEGMEQLKLPPMILQLLVENAVKHGISKLSEGGLITIDIDKGDGFLNLRVQNTGNLNTSSNLGGKLGVGLDNIRKRLELIYNGKASLVMSESENNVQATIKIPMS